MDNRQIKLRENCPLCFGSGKIKSNKVLVKIGPYKLVKEEFKDNCNFCLLEEFDKSFQEHVIN